MTCSRVISVSRDGAERCSSKSLSTFDPVVGLRSKTLILHEQAESWEIAHEVIRGHALRPYPKHSTSRKEGLVRAGEIWGKGGSDWRK